MNLEKSIEDYHKSEIAINDRIEHISKVFDETDVDNVWWHVESYIDFDISWTIALGKIAIYWQYTQPFDDWETTHSYALPLDLFKSASDEELSRYCKLFTDRTIQHDMVEQLRTTYLQIHRSPELYKFISSFDNFNEFIDTSIDEVIKDYIEQLNVNIV